MAPLDPLQKYGTHLCTYTAPARSEHNRSSVMMRRADRAVKQRTLKIKRQRTIHRPIEFDAAEKREA